MSRRRSSAAVGAVGVATDGAEAEASPAAPSPAVSRSSLAPSWRVTVTVPTNDGFTLPDVLLLLSPPQPARPSTPQPARPRLPASASPLNDAR